jgi:hypothetical protein
MIEKTQYDEAVRMIERENKIKDYSKWAGPSVLAAVKGISPIKAAEILWDIQEPKIRGLTNPYALGRALNKQVVSATLIRDDEASERGIVKFSDRFPSLNNWLEDNKDKVAVLKVGHAFAYVAFGVMIKQFGFEGMRGKVTHAIVLR